MKPFLSRNTFFLFREENVKLIQNIACICLDQCAQFDYACTTECADNVVLCHLGCPCGAYCPDGCPCSEHCNAGYNQTTLILSNTPDVQGISTNLLNLKDVKSKILSKFYLQRVCFIYETVFFCSKYC